MLRADRGLGYLSWVQGARADSSEGFSLTVGVVGDG